MDEQRSELAAYLADRDVPCPRCGYSLRDLRGSVCPECGRALVMQEFERPQPRAMSYRASLIVTAVALAIWVTNLAVFADTPIELKPTLLSGLVACVAAVCAITVPGDVRPSRDESRVGVRLVTILVQVMFGVSVILGFYGTLWLMIRVAQVILG